MIQSKLWWVAGYPRERTWHVPASPAMPAASLELTGTHLSAATHAVNKLMAGFPRALPRLVGDRVAGGAGARTVLARLKPWVHDGTAPPTDLFATTDLFPRTTRQAARGLVGAHPRLAGLVGALSWIGACHPKDAGRWLAVVERFARELTFVVAEDAEATAIDVVRLVTLHAGGRADALMELLGSAPVARTPLALPKKVLDGTFRSLNPKRRKASLTSAVGCSV